MRNVCDFFKSGFVYASAFAAMSLLAACSNDNVAGGASGDAGVYAIKNLDVAGVTQKGPFVTGSAVAVHEIDCKTMKISDEHFEGAVKSDKGDFAIKDINLQSQYAILEASGYYRDEISGKKSSGTVTLRALTDLSNRKTVNINLLTHLEYERVMYLVTEKKKSIAEAKEQAEKEILASFGIDGDFAESEDLNIFESGDGNAALLAVSVLMQSDVDVAGLTERMGEFSIALAEGGSWDDADTKTAIADWACDVDLKGTLANVRKNVESWKYADTVPAFEKFVTNFWWDNYGLGSCTAKREGDVKRDVNKLSKLYNEYFVCENGQWVIPGDESASSLSSSSKDIEPAETSSSSVYNPFVEGAVKSVPQPLSFIDSNYVRRGYVSYGDGKQDVWLFSPANGFGSGGIRDSAISAFVETLGKKGFAFEKSVKNDSLERMYDDTSYVYQKKDGNVVYKVAITKWYSSTSYHISFDVKVIILRDGFEEVPTTDYSSMRYETDLPEEMSFLGDFATSKYKNSWDDSLQSTSWIIYNSVYKKLLTTETMDNPPEEEKMKMLADSVEYLRGVLEEKGFVLDKVDSAERTTYYYVYETEIAKYDVQVNAKANKYGDTVVLGDWYYDYCYYVSVVTYYKKKLDRGKVLK